MKLGQVFDPRSNALNAWRLALAAEVILWHSYPITGRTPPSASLQLLFAVGVDGFFAISGFLIARSWLTNPRVREYATARALRILPAFYVCLAVTAFVIAPIGVAIQGGSASKLLLSTGPIEYVLGNSAILYVHPDIGGTPQGIPLAGTWNGSLWSLFWEVVCYLCIALIGVVGLATRRWVSPILFLLAVAGALALPPLTASPETWTFPQIAARAAIMFAAGAFLFQWKDVIPAHWLLVVVSVVIVVVASILLPDYRIVAAIPLAYALIVSAALIRNRRMVLRTDLSYGLYIYAFPMQQLLAIIGLSFLDPILFFIVATLATLPLAALSWFLIEKRAMALKARLKRTSIAAEESPPEEASGSSVLQSRP